MVTNPRRKKGLELDELPLPAYHRVWARDGFDESDWTAPGSDRLIDMIVAWGDEAAIRARIAEYEEAGASHIAVSAYNPEGCWDWWEKTGRENPPCSLPCSVRSLPGGERWFMMEPA